MHTGTLDAVRASFPFFYVFQSMSEVTGELFTASETLTLCGSDECFAHSVLDAGQSSVARTAVLTVQIFVPMLFQVWISVRQKTCFRGNGLPMRRRLPRCHIVIKPDMINVTLHAE